MNQKTLVSLSMVALLSVCTTSALAENGNTLIYGGGGSQSDSGVEANEDTAISIGATFQSETSDFIMGIDFGFEGTMLDSTYGQTNAVEQGTSYNLLLGKNISTKGNVKIDLLGLIGAREEAQDCAASFIGYQCYANTDPDTSYTVNYGALMTISYESLALGYRVTNASQQIVVGVRF